MKWLETITSISFRFGTIVADYKHLPYAYK